MGGCHYGDRQNARLERSWLDNLARCVVKREREAGDLNQPWLPVATGLDAQLQRALVARRAEPSPKQKQV
jgi:cob(I)alamin adenosyltransferase